MYRVPLYELRVKEVGQFELKERLRPVISPSAAAEIMRDYFAELDKEHFGALYLDTKNKVICFHTVSIGTLNSTIVQPREVFKAGLIFNAAGVIVAHNHPSGDPRPSREDIRLTHRLVESGKLIGLEVMDHIIFGRNVSLSLREEGKM